jgi:hypothetical protein
VNASPVEQHPAPGPPARATAGRVAAFLAVLALTAAAGWQLGRVLEPPLPVPALTHDHSGTAP